MLGKGVVSEIRLKAFISPLSLRWDWYGLTFYIVTASVQFLLKQKPTSVCKHQSLLILLVLIKYYLPTLFHCDIATLDAVIVPYCPHNCFSPGECLAPTNLFQSAWQKIIFFLMYKKVDTNIFFFYPIFHGCVCSKHALHYLEWKGYFLNAVPRTNVAGLPCAYKTLHFHSPCYLQFVNMLS